MKKNRAIIIGILIFIAAVGLLFYAFMPSLAVFTVPLWKWFLAAAILYWLIKKIVFSNVLANRLSVFIPLALAFMLFEPEIGALLGKGDDFVNNGYVILAAALLDAAVWIFFRPRNKKFFSGGSRTSSAGETITVGGSESNGEPLTFKLGSHIYYADASSQTTLDMINQLSELKIYYQNADTGDTEATLYLNIVNQLGETRIFVPRSWHVELSTENSMGSVNCRPDGDVTTRTIVIRVKNQMGDVGIVSED
ncbi:MAG: hypothetical protein J6X47_08765 [Clostridia bacterium]|nr:hypothetical protein [Clostridia bacterium]MBP5767063.1 hypothetical protein [Clostridia bacterium]